MLTDVKLKSLKPKATLYRVADAHGLTVVAPEVWTGIYRT